MSCVILFSSPESNGRQNLLKESAFIIFLFLSFSHVYSFLLFLLPLPLPASCVSPRPNDKRYIPLLLDCFVSVFHYVTVCVMLQLLLFSSELFCMCSLSSSALSFIAYSPFCLPFPAYTCFNTFSSSSWFFSFFFTLFSPVSSIFSLNSLLLPVNNVPSSPLCIPGEMLSCHSDEPDIEEGNPKDWFVSFEPLYLFLSLCHSPHITTHQIQYHPFQSSLNAEAAELLEILTRFELEGVCFAFDQILEKEKHKLQELKLQPPTKHQQQQLTSKMTTTTSTAATSTSVVSSPPSSGQQLPQPPKPFHPPSQHPQLQPFSSSSSTATTTSSSLTTSSGPTSTSTSTPGVAAPPSSHHHLPHPPPPSSAITTTTTSPPVTTTIQYDPLTGKCSLYSLDFTCCLLLLSASLIDCSTSPAFSIDWRKKEPFSRSLCLSVFSFSSFLFSSEFKSTQTLILSLAMCEWEWDTHSLLSQIKEKGGRKGKKWTLNYTVVFCQECCPACRNTSHDDVCNDDDADKMKVGEREGREKFPAKRSHSKMVMAMTRDASLSSPSLCCSVLFCSVIPNLLSV